MIKPLLLHFMKILLWVSLKAKTLHLLGSSLLPATHLLFCIVCTKQKQSVAMYCIVNSFRCKHNEFTVSNNIPIPVSF